MSALSSGQILGPHFLLERSLGRGGAAEAWLARDLDRDRPVVLKVLHPDAPPEQALLLEREFRALQRLDHPNIVPVFGFHQDEGLSFLSTGYVEGEEIGLRRGRPAAEILPLLPPIADALAHAHERGIVHRDLKASNVLVDAAGRPQVVDFGMAGLAAGPDIRGGGSPLTVSPRQAAGDAPSPADDLYSLGALIFDLVSGRTPEPPEPMVSAQPVPDALQDLVARLLAGAPGERPSDMATVAAELRALAEEAPALPPAAPAASRPGVQITPPPRATPIRAVSHGGAEGPGAPAAARRGRRHGLGILVAVGAPLVVAAVLFFFLPQVAERMREDAPPPEAMAGTTPEAHSPAGEPRETGPAPLPAEEEEVPPPDPVETAREAAARVAELETALAERRVSLWAPREMAAARARARAAQDLLDDGEAGRAAASFKEAVESLEGLVIRSGEVLRESLSRGENALQFGDQPVALESFELAAAIEPGNRQAALGLERAKVLDQVIEAMEDAVRAERAGDLRRAEEGFRRAVSLDPRTKKANQGLARVRKRIADDAFGRVMGEGLEAMEQAGYRQAVEAFRRATKMRPDSSEAARWLAQAEEALKMEAVAALHREAERREAAEDWKGAVEAYDEALQIDPALRFARTGKERALERAKMAAEMEYHIQHPDRLGTDAVWEEASKLLARAASAEPAGERHRRQILKLEDLLEKARSPVRVTLESDDRTEVTVYRVGRLGSFRTRSLELRPGTYTVVGSRAGYRDVRLELVVRPGQPPRPLVVRCEERL